jgi:hypothetical protein
MVHRWTCNTRTFSPWGSSPAFSSLTLDAALVVVPKLPMDAILQEGRRFSATDCNVKSSLAKLSRSLGNVEGHHHLADSLSAENKLLGLLAAL